MRFSKAFTVIVILGLTMNVLSGCSSSSKTVHNNQNSLQVFVSILPQAYFAEKIGGDHVEISVLIPPGADPHTFEPTPQQMRKLAGADLYLQIGTMEFEKQWMPRIKAQNSDMEVVDISQSVPLVDGDPHIWLSPRLAKIQAENIYLALKQIDAVHQNDYYNNYKTLLNELDQLDLEIAAQLQPVSSREFLVFHPSWRYFAENYGLQEIAIEQDGKEPSAQEMARLIDQARQKGIRVILVSPQHSTHQAQAIARDLGGRVITVDPLARDYAENLRKAAQQLADELDNSPGGRANSGQH